VDRPSPPNRQGTAIRRTATLAQRLTPHFWSRGIWPIRVGAMTLSPFIGRRPGSPGLVGPLAYIWRQRNGDPVQSWISLDMARPAEHARNPSNLAQPPFAKGPPAVRSTRADAASATVAASPAPVSKKLGRPSSLGTMAELATAHEFSQARPQRVRESGSNVACWICPIAEPPVGALALARPCLLSKPGGRRDVGSSDG